MADTAEDRSDRTIAISAPRTRLPPVPLVHLLAFTLDGELRRVAIPPGGLSIGRQPPCELTLPMPEISRRHCRIDLDGDWAVLRDLGSTNGTFLGAERLSRPVRLRNGVRFALGSFALRYERRDAREAAQEAELAADIRRAADYVRAILPQPITSGPVQTEWWFAPCSHLGGDAFGYQAAGDTLFTGFVLDVTGHGIGAAMHAAAVANALRRRTLPEVDFTDPASVAAGLNRTFPMEDHDGLMLTIWYFVYDTASRLLRFCAAGHHPAFLVSPAAPEPVPLWLRSPAIGLLPRGNWAVGRAEMPAGGRLYLFSDGAFEIVTASGQQWVLEDLRQIMRGPEQPGVSEAQRLWQAVRAAARPGPLDDDFLALVLRFS